MPSTTTTSVTIGTILDLIGPTTPAASNDESQTGFDSLLSATQPLSSDHATQSESDTSPSIPHSRQVDENPDSSANHWTSDDSRATNSDESAGSTQPSSAPTSTPAESNKSDSPAEHEPSERDSEKQEDSEKTDDQLATEQLIAQSLAALSSAPQDFPIVISTPEEVTANNNEASNAAGDAADTNASLASLPSQTKTTNRHAQVEDAGIEVQENGVSGREPQDTVSDPLTPIAPIKTAGSELTEAAAKQQAIDGQATELVVGFKEETNEERPDDGLQRSSDIEPTSDGPKEQLKQGHLQDTEAPSSLNAIATDARTADGAKSTSQSATESPVVAPIVSSASSANQATPANNSSTSTALTNPAIRARLPAQAQAAATNAPTRSAPVETDAARLISRVVRAFSAAQDRDGEVRLRLSPPELGSLRLDVRVENGALTAHLQTETDSARLAIIDNLPALRDRLAEQGIRIERFDVDLMQRQSTGTPDQPGSGQRDTPDASPRVGPRPAVLSAPPQRSTAPPNTISNGSGGLNVVV